MITKKRREKFQCLEGQLCVKCRFRNYDLEVVKQIQVVVSVRMVDNKLKLLRDSLCLRWTQFPDAAEKHRLDRGFPVRINVPRCSRTRVLKFRAVLSTQGTSQSLHVYI